MTTFIYYWGALSLCYVFARGVLALVDLIEGGEKVIFWILFFILYFPAGIIWRLCKNFMK